MIQLFISSVQKEFQAERHAIRDFVRKDALLSQFFTVFLFEDLPPIDQRPDEVYLDKVKSSPIYIGLFGNQYGSWRDDEGLSPTEKEYRLATQLCKRRIVLVKKDNTPEPEMKALIAQAGSELVRKRFGSTEELLDLVHRSLIHYLQDEGVITTREFDAQTSADITLNDIAAEKVQWFLERARVERNYAVEPGSPVEAVLSHLDLLVDGQPTKGAVLLFGKHPKSQVSGADINCLHFHGTEMVKPIPSQQVYQGTVFEMVDAAVDFVMAKIARTVVPSVEKVASDVRYEIPYKVVREAIVNALAHRDRLEVWNSGGLPEGLTIDQLRVPHRSVPRNRLLCEPLYLTRYIERAGTGTLDMIRLCAEAGLPEPQFRSEGDQFVATIWRDWLTDEVINELGLNERQVKAIQLVKEEGRITNKMYREAFGITDRTALRDLKELVKLEVFERVGETGQQTYYVVKVPTRHGRMNEPDMEG